MFKDNIIIVNNTMFISIQRDGLIDDELKQIDTIIKASNERLKCYEAIALKIFNLNSEIGHEFFKFVDKKSIVCVYATYNIQSMKLEDVGRWLTYQQLLYELVETVYKNMMPQINYNSYFKSEHIYKDKLCIDYIIEVNSIKYIIGFLYDKIYKIQISDTIFNTNWFITKPNLVNCIKDIVPIIHIINKIQDKVSFLKFFDITCIETNHFLGELETAVGLFNTIKRGVKRLDSIKTDITYKYTKIYVKLYLQVGILQLEYLIDNIGGLVSLLNNIQLDTK
jgi:hypothetical protein